MPSAYVDKREMNELIKLGQSFVPGLEPKMLVTGDVVNVIETEEGPKIGQLAVERKEISDLVGSLVDGRLFSQAKRLRQEFNNPYLIVVGTLEYLWEDERYTWFTEQHFWGIVATLNEKYGVGTIQAETEEEFWLAVSKLIEKHNDQRPIRPHNVFAPDTDDPYYDMLCRVKGVGEAKASAVLEKIPFYKLFTCDKEDLLEVDGIGPAFADRIKEVFNEETAMKTRQK